MEAETWKMFRRPIGLLMVVVSLGLASSACARVQSHFALPDLAMGDAAFGPAIEAYTATRVVGGNTVDLLLNGDVPRSSPPFAPPGARSRTRSTSMSRARCRSRSRRPWPSAAGPGYGLTSCSTASGPSRCRRRIGRP